MTSSDEEEDAWTAWDGTTFVVARSAIKSRQAGQVHDADGDVLADVRVSPRILWGCLTVFVSVGLFFGVPVLTGWLINALLKLFGSDLQQVLDRSLWVGIPLVVLIVATGILGTMMAAWSLYRQIWRVRTEDQQVILEIIETGKSGAASLTAEILNEAGQRLGWLHHDLWGEITIRDAGGQECLRAVKEGSKSSRAAQAGLSVLASAAISFILALITGGMIAVFLQQNRIPYRILRSGQTESDEAAVFGSLVPVEPRARRLRLKGRPTQTEKQLCIAVAVVVAMYDF
jgi:hypothetical protein